MNENETHTRREGVRVTITMSNRFTRIFEERPSRGVPAGAQTTEPYYYCLRTPLPVARFAASTLALQTGPHRLAGGCLLMMIALAADPPHHGPLG